MLRCNNFSLMRLSRAANLKTLRDGDAYRTWRMRRAASGVTGSGDERPANMQRGWAADDGKDAAQAIRRSARRGRGMQPAKPAMVAWPSALRHFSSGTSIRRRPANRQPGRGKQAARPQRQTDLAAGLSPGRSGREAHSVVPSCGNGFRNL